jgi:putative alpha-1,2-mannosidase
MIYIKDLLNKKFWMSISFVFLLVLNAQAQTKLTQYVNPMVGTSGHGHTYPGAALPFGLVQLSPDTDDKGWDWCSGYHYSDSSIIGLVTHTLVERGALT